MYFANKNRAKNDRQSVFTVRQTTRVDSSNPTAPHKEFRANLSNEVGSRQVQKKC